MAAKVKCMLADLSRGIDVCVCSRKLVQGVQKFRLCYFSFYSLIVPPTLFFRRIFLALHAMCYMLYTLLQDGTK